MRLEELMPGLRVRGLTAEAVEIVSTSWVGGDFLQITYRDSTGATAEGLVNREDEAVLSVDAPGRDRRFGADPRLWKLGVEALRIKHAALIDPMLAVSSSTLQPLPHQIKAVYGEFLPRTPLRYLLADDPGAGKTIMCGLYVKELVLRGDLERCLIVAPGGLVEQWQDELWEKFGLQFKLLSRELIASTVSASVFEENPLLIARMDMLSRNDELMEQMDRSEWDLVVVDEAHRMSARYAGTELVPTKRYTLGKRLARLTRNLLLMTATPHAGDASAFQAFLALLDEDRFQGRGRSSLAPGTDLMRRMLKEELLTMDGRPLFPERRAQTVTYTLTDLELRLYQEVSDYVRHEMNRAERLKREGDGRAAYTVGFALTVLQRRLASSPEAILRSLERRRARLTRIREELASGGAAQAPELGSVDTRNLDEEEWLEQDLKKLEDDEEALVDAASAARTVAELDVEISSLDVLVTLATQVRRAGKDRKWSELRSILEEHELTKDAQGRPRKIIVFTEHRDTLRYLTQRIRELPGRADAVVEIHGGVSRPARRDVQDRFTRDPGTSVLVATDAAGEGLNLQCAHLMVNYDLPWNPNRIEQRFGRIHRIGQTEVCHLWNLVADGTREGDVFRRLLAKMAEQSKAYQGKVFDVLGEAFEGEPLRDLLVKAIRHGDDPDVRRQLETVIDERVSAGIPELVERRALYQTVLEQVDVEQARDRLDAGGRTQLQPYFTSSWFESTLKELGGRVRRRPDGFHDVGFVPDAVRSAGRRGTAAIVRSRYEVVSFDPQRTTGEPGVLPELVAPGHPLLDAVADVAERQWREVLREGAVLVDPDPRASRCRVFFGVSHDMADGHATPNTLSRRVAFVELDGEGFHGEVGPTYLDYRSPLPTEESALDRVLADHPFLDQGRELATEWAMRHLVGEHRSRVAQSHTTAVERARDEVTRRLEAEIAHWSAEAERNRRSDDAQRRERDARRVQALQSRLARRLEELAADARVVARPPRVLASAVVVPVRLLSPQVEEAVLPPGGLDLVHAAEQELGHEPGEWVEAGTATVRSTRPDGLSRWIDVHHAPRDGGGVRVTRTQVLQARNLGDRHRLALVQPSRNGAGGATLRYAVDPFARIRTEDFHQHEYELSWNVLWRSAREPW
ncbi:helicase-related protein [Nocardioides sp. GCM10027113]|uniref:helicase-related protein n=1 Tax=unclassified Nocardioides TaxID=2615069 RepID=UPI00362269ED